MLMSQTYRRHGNEERYIKNFENSLFYIMQLRFIKAVEKNLLNRPIAKKYLKTRFNKDHFVIDSYI